MSFFVSNNISFQTIGERCYIFKEPSGDIVQLNKTAEAIFTMVAKGIRIEEIKSQYAELFSISSRLADEDVGEVLGMLEMEGVVKQI